MGIPQGQRQFVSYRESACMAAIFTFSESLNESLAKSGRPCMGFDRHDG
ncbi:hypothetical protein SAMN05428952_10925 [Nitrosomonas sp. Nm132]|nr:hypothetical protein SAMN05428952_10925 [Nitrosomonas sp. Nm132]